MKKTRLKFLLLLMTITICLCVPFTACTGLFGSDISIEEENLVTDYTCYIGNYHCPKLYVKVKNTC